MDWYSISDPAIRSEIGKRLKEYRIRKNYTQRELAVKAGISVLSVQNLEKGNPISVSTFISVLRMLNLLENLGALIPEPPVSPVELLKLKGKTRFRVKKPGLRQKI
jgi:transcriptional regulator with XRE-family HTH domain